MNGPWNHQPLSSWIDVVTLIAVGVTVAPVTVAAGVPSAVPGPVAVAVLASAVTVAAGVPSAVPGLVAAAVTAPAVTVAAGVPAAVPGLVAVSVSAPAVTLSTGGAAGLPGPVAVAVAETAVTVAAGPLLAMPGSISVTVSGTAVSLESTPLVPIWHPGGVPGFGGPWGAAAPSGEIITADIAVKLPSLAAVSGSAFVHLVEFTVAGGDPAAETCLPPLVWGCAPLSAVPFGSSLPSGVVPVRYSDAGWIGEPADSAYPSVPFPGRAAVPRIQRSIPIFPAQGKRGTRTVGAIDFAAGDGALDQLAARAVAGRLVAIRRGPASAPIHADYARILRVAAVPATGWSGGDGTWSLELGSDDARVTVPLSRRSYLGTGGAEGGDDLAGTTMPVGIGAVFNAKPDVLDKVSGLLRLNWRRIQAVRAIRDRGDALTDDGIDYPTVDALLAATVNAGHYRTCLAEGVVRAGISWIGTSPDLSADFDGDVDRWGRTTDSHGGAVRLLLGDYAGILDFAAESTYALPAGRAYWFWPAGNSATVADALDAVLGSCGGWWALGRDERYRVGAPAHPRLLAPRLTLGARHLRGKAKRLSRPYQPCRSVTVGYAAPQTQQQASALAPDVSDADRKRWSEAYQTVSAGDPGVWRRTPAAIDLTLISAFVDEVPAQWLADQLQATFGPDLDPWQVPLGPEAAAIDLGDCIALPLPGRGDAAPAIVGAFDEAGASSIVTVWA